MSSPKAVQTKRSQPQVVPNDGQPSTATADSSEKIREAAYYKWEAAGCPCCDGVEFWLQAEAEMSTDNRPGKPR
jgi:hypothetical protein